MSLNDFYAVKDGRPGKATFADNFTTCNRFISEDGFTPFTLDAVRREEFSKAASAAIAQHRRSPADNRHLTGLASAALSAFLPQQQALKSSSFLSSIRFGTLDQQNSSHLNAFRQPHHFVNNSGSSRFPLLLRTRQLPVDLLNHKHHDDFHRRKDPQHRQHFNKHRQFHHFSNNDQNHRSVSPGSNYINAANRKRSYRDLDAPDPVQAKLDRRRLVSYADIVCPNADDEPSRPRWNRRRRYSSSTERSKPTDQPQQQNDVIITVLESPKQEINQVPEEVREQSVERVPSNLSIESPEEDEFEENLKAELDRVKGNDKRKKQININEPQPLNADQILKHLTSLEAPSMIISENVDPVFCKSTSNDVPFVVHKVPMVDELAHNIEPELASKHLAAEHGLIIRSIPFGDYECNRDFRRRLHREYRQFTGCSRMPKPLTNFQMFSVLNELSELHLNDDKARINNKERKNDNQLLVDINNECMQQDALKAFARDSLSSGAAVNSSTADILGYMKSILAAQTSNPLSFGMSHPPPNLQQMYNSNMLQTNPSFSTGLSNMGTTLTHPISLTQVALPFDFRPGVPPPNYRPQPMFNQYNHNFMNANRLPVFNNPLQQNSTFFPTSTMDIPRILRSEQFTNALLQLSAAASGNSTGNVERQHFNNTSPYIAASIANSLIANQQQQFYGNLRSARGTTPLGLNPMSEVVREAQEFVRSRLANNNGSIPVQDVKPIPNVIGPLGTGIVPQHWSPDVSREDYISAIMKLNHDSGSRTSSTRDRRN